MNLGDTDCDDNDKDTSEQAVEAARGEVGDDNKVRSDDNNMEEGTEDGPSDHEASATHEDGSGRGNSDKSKDEGLHSDGEDEGEYDKAPDGNT